MKISSVIVSSFTGPKPEPVPPELGIQGLRPMSIPQQRDGTLTNTMCEFDDSGHQEQATVLPPNFFEVRFAKISLNSQHRMRWISQLKLEVHSWTDSKRHTPSSIGGQLKRASQCRHHSVDGWPTRVILTGL